MLKIADNVDLKELEKFGFKKLKYEDYDYYEYRNEFESYRIMFIDINDRKIHNCNEEDTLYDLIQAGIVVKE